MKTPTSLVTLLSAFAVAVLVGPGIAYGEEVAAQEPASDVSQHIYAVADAIRFDEVSVTVPFADLNLNNEKGAAVLYRRLQIAGAEMPAVPAAC